jgi:hypothetical protein
MEWVMKAHATAPLKGEFMEIYELDTLYLVCFLHDISFLHDF